MEAEKIAQRYFSLRMACVRYYTLRQKRSHIVRGQRTARKREITCFLLYFLPPRERERERNKKKQRNHPTESSTLSAKNDTLTHRATIQPPTSWCFMFFIFAVKKIWEQNTKPHVFRFFGSSNKEKFGFWRQISPFLFEPKHPRNLLSMSSWVKRSHRSLIACFVWKRTTWNLPFYDIQRCEHLSISESFFFDKGT